jgi:endonuclease/exonuclease/phosphatase family metal-dependent hydrolase
MLRRLVAMLFVCTVSLAVVHPAAAAPDIVLRASNFTNVHGNWAIGYSSTAADGRYMGSTDYGWSTTSAPLAQPNDYFEARFDAPAGTSYHVWVRVRASANSKYNDSVWLQYSDAVTTSGSAVYRIGTTGALDVNLERCSGCGVASWGWQDGAYWLSQSTTVRFATTGTHTLRVQIREDGAQIDQIVLSNGPYLFASPGSMTNDTVIVPLGGGSTTTTAGPYLGSPISLPGHIKAEDFDSGADGVSYHDSTAGNTGGQYRQTNVDIQGCAEGGYNVGWTEPGEWLNYSVNVAAAGSYTVKLRVATPSGASLHVGFNGPSSVWRTVSIPATGGWQSWTTVSVPVTLGAGAQLMTLLFDTSGLNLNYIDVTSGSTSTTTTTTTPTTTAPSTSTGGSSVSVVTWNIQVNDYSATHAQRAVDYVMAMTPRPQIVVLEEARQSQFSTYINALQARSGQTWRGVLRTHCPSGAWNGSSCTGVEDEGVAVFSSLPLVDSGTTFLPYADSYHSARGVARMAVSVGGVVLQVFSVHLPPNNVSARAGAMSTLKAYASRYSAPQIVGGDFNADRNEIDPAMLPNFVDSWGQVGSGSGYTAFTSSPSMKIDYWLQDAGGRARPEWSVVVTATGTFSDHYPVINSYSVR